MEKVKKIITDSLLVKLKKLTPDQVIFGEPYHPQRLPHKADRPEYARIFSPEPQPMCQICYCNRGECVITINDTSFHLTQGDICFIRRNVSHYESYFTPGRAYELTWLHPWKKLRIHQAIYTKDGRFYTVNNQHIGISDESIRQLDKIILLGFDHKKEQWTAVKKMIVDIFAYYQKQKLIMVRQLLNKWQVRLINEVSHYIKDHCNEKLSLKEIAKKFSYSPNYLDTLYKKECAEGIVHGIICQRLCRASQLLETTQLNISEIARQCGFNEAYYFSRIFKKNLVVTPTEYRKIFS